MFRQDTIESNRKFMYQLYKEYKQHMNMEYVDPEDEPEENGIDEEIDEEMSAKALKKKGKYYQIIMPGPQQKYLTLILYFLEKKKQKKQLKAQKKEEAKRLAELNGETEESHLENGVAENNGKASQNKKKAAEPENKTNKLKEKK